MWGFELRAADAAAPACTQNRQSNNSLRGESKAANARAVAASASHGLLWGERPFPRAMPRVTQMVIGRSHVTPGLSAKVLSGLRGFRLWLSH